MKLKVLNPDNTNLTQAQIKIREDRMKAVACVDTMISMDQQTRTTIYVDTAVDEAVTALELLERAVAAEKEGYDAIGIYCSNDPAIDAIREAVSIPVVGAGSASIQIAMGLGEHISWITTDENTMGAERCIRKSGLDFTRISSIRQVVLDVAASNDFDRDAVLDSLEACGRACMKDGAHVIILGCLLFAGMGPELSKRLGIPVVDPAHAIVSMAELLVHTSLCQSRAAYPKPSRQERKWSAGSLEL